MDQLQIGSTTKSSDDESTDAAETIDADAGGRVLGHALKISVARGSPDERQVKSGRCWPAVVEMAERQAAAMSRWSMEQFWKRVPLWGDWVVAIVVAIVVLNLNITTAGDPLSGVGLSAGPSSAGITEGGRTAFYAALIVGGVVLVAAGLLMTARHEVDGALLARTFSLVALAGVLGLLLDYRDGPVSTVQLIVYLLLFLGVVRLARVVSIAGRRQALD